MKVIVIAIVFLFSASMVFSQKSTYNKDSYKILHQMDFFNTYKAGRGDVKAILEQNEIKGTPYLNDDFIKGTIYTTSEQKYVDLPLRYNIYNDELEFKTPEDKVLALGTPEIIEAVEYGDQVMVYLPYTDNTKIKKGYFKVLLLGDVSLFSKYVVEFKEAGEPNAYDNAKPAEFSRNKDVYYLKIGNEQAKKVGTKKELIEAFPDHKKEIESFVKKNKIKPSDPDKLKALINFYSTL